MEEKTLKEKLSIFDNSYLFVIDFSAVVNIKSQDRLNLLIKYILDNKIKVAVSRAFYENYDVVIMSRNAEQAAIAKATYDFLDLLEKSDALLCMSDIIDSKEIVEKLNMNPKVCFIYYKNSEFSENVCHARKTLEVAAIVVDESGELNVCTERNEVISASASIIDAAALDDDYFGIKFEPSVGAEVKTRNGDSLTLGDLVGSGGEGAVYNCQELSDHVIKVYHKGQLNRLRLKKIFLMEKKQVRYDGICWPEKAVFSKSNEPVGFLMKKIIGTPLSAVLDSPETLLETFPSWKKKDLINMAIGILQKIQYLHLFGILIGDLRLKNIVITDKGEPCIVDIDSCQVDNLPCPAGISDYTAPELQHIEFKKQLRTYENENFSCAVLIFKVLFCGLHPYNQKFDNKSLEQRIASHSFPYPQSINGDFSKIPWGGYEQIWKCMPFQIQTMFCEIFKKDNRCSVQEMILMLKTYMSFLDINKDVLALNEIIFDYD